MRFIGDNLIYLVLFVDFYLFLIAPNIMFYNYFLVLLGLKLNGIPNL